MADFQPYVPSPRFNDVAALYGNHFRFALNDLPDLTFFCQQIVLPDVSAGAPQRGNPFTLIPEVGDHLNFSALNCTYLVDSKFLSYYSLFYWMRGYGFPRSFEDIGNFETDRKRRIGNPIPKKREIQKTSATLSVLRPDTDGVISQINFLDVFPVQLGQMSFTTTEGDAPLLTCQVTFRYTDFEVVLS